MSTFKSAVQPPAALAVLVLDGQRDASPDPSEDGSAWDAAGVTGAASLVQSLSGELWVPIDDASEGVFGAKYTPAVVG